MLRGSLFPCMHTPKFRPTELPSHSYLRATSCNHFRLQQLLLSWGWSIGQRFLLNEPAIIVLSKGLPILFTSELCSRCNPCWSESLGELLAMSIEVVINVLRSLKV